MPAIFAEEEPRQLIWSDEFETPGRPDTKKWAFDTGGGGFGNQEAQYYTDRSENSRVEEGRLIIETHKEQIGDNHYTSAKLLTKGITSWKYARIEVRAKLPMGRGTWPAIWMLADSPQLSWPDDGEIDIMEHVGHAPGVIHASLHSKDYNHMRGTQKTATMTLPKRNDEFHVYALEWSEERIDFFIDGQCYHTVVNEHAGWEKWPFDKPFYLILNLAIGGTWGGEKGIDDSCFPQRFEVDYVRVYSPKPK